MGAFTEWHVCAVLGPMRLSASDGTNVFGMHRTDLLDILAQALSQGKIRQDHACNGFAQDHVGVGLHLANGKSAEADVLVGAYGIGLPVVLDERGECRPIFSALGAGVDNPAHICVFCRQQRCGVLTSAHATASAIM